METTKMRIFQEPELGALVRFDGNKNFLEMDQKGVILLPNGARPNIFWLMLAVMEDSRTVIVQKNVSVEGGEYRNALSQLPSDGNYKIFKMDNGIEVVRQGGVIYTNWHGQGGQTNRADVWVVKKDGKTDLFQVGVITHDKGKTFRLLGEYRWRGQLFNRNGIWVGKPLNRSWGSLEGGTSKRTQIFQHPEFIKLVQAATLPVWEGAEEDIDPPLGPVPGPEFARVKFFVPFGGRTGWGIAFLKDGSEVVINGSDILDPSDNDGIKRLACGQLIAFKGVGPSGSNPGAKPRIMNVRKAD